MVDSIRLSPVMQPGDSANLASLPSSIHSATELGISNLSHLKRKQITDDIGTIHGELTILSFAFCKNGQIWYNCRCLCGNEKPIRRDYLLNGHTRSCGCLVKEDCNLSGQQFGPWTVLRRDTTKMGPPAYSPARHRLHSCTRCLHSAFAWSRFLCHCPGRRRCAALQPLR